VAQMDPSAGIEEEYHHKNDKVPTCSFMMFVFASNMQWKCLWIE
jgi:hypothetical protein